jgi:cell division protein FtsB
MTTKRRKYRTVKKKKKSSSKTRFLLLLFIGILIYLFVQGDQGFLKYIELQKEKKKLLEQIEVLKKENEELVDEVELLTKNYRYIEKKARELHYMGKKGEKIYLISPPKK